jgi:hypothetical protein
MSNYRQGQSPDYMGTSSYVTLRRPCDDPRSNFEKIRDNDLWWAREKRLQEAEARKAKRNEQPPKT